MWDIQPTCQQKQNKGSLFCLGECQEALFSLPQKRFKRYTQNGLVLSFLGGLSHNPTTHISLGESHIIKNYSENSKRVQRKTEKEQVLLYLRARQRWVKNFPRAWSERFRTSLMKLEEDGKKHKDGLEQIVQPNVKCAGSNTSNWRIIDRSD